MDRGSDEIFRSIVIAFLFTLSAILSFVPFFGTPLSFCVTWYDSEEVISHYREGTHSTGGWWCGYDCGLGTVVVASFIYSYYSFEYVWSLDGLDFIERSRVLESNW